MKITVKAVIVSIIAVAVLATAIAVLAQYIGAGPSELSPKQYVLIEHYVETQATLPGDNSTTDAYVYLGYPTYNSSQLAALVSKTYIPRINDSLKAIYQDGSGVGKSGCHGAQYFMSGVYELPYNDSSGFHIESVDGSGVAHVTYNGQSLTIKPCDTWYSNRTMVDNVRFVNTTVNETITVNLLIVDRIKNYGIYQK